MNASEFVRALSTTERVHPRDGSGKGSTRDSDCGDGAGNGSSRGTSYGRGCGAGHSCSEGSVSGRGGR